MSGPFDPDFEDLPRALPIFPLTGVLLLPGGQLPLNIFEPRYLNMIADSLMADRMLGMIQPTRPESTEPNPPVYPTGCAGRITAFEETDDRRYVITLSGLCRFRIIEELPVLNGYRRVVPDWTAYRSDMQEPAEEEIDRDRLVERLQQYFDQQGINANWEAIEQSSNERLVTTLAMICPFQASEKQALLETRTLAERIEVMIALMEMAGPDEEGTESPVH